MPSFSSRALISSLSARIDTVGGGGKREWVSEWERERDRDRERVCGCVWEGLCVCECVDVCVRLVINASPTLFSIPIQYSIQYRFQFWGSERILNCNSSQMYCYDVLSYLNPKMWTCMTTVCDYCCESILYGAVCFSPGEWLLTLDHHVRLGDGGEPSVQRVDLSRGQETL